MSSIGPQLPSQTSAKRKRTPEPSDDHGTSPPKQARHNADEIDLDGSDSDDDDYGPRAPGTATTTSKPSLGPSLPSSAAAPTASKPSLGPSLSPSAATAAAAHNQDEIGLDDSDSDTGPAPPPQPAAAAAQPEPDSDSDSDDDYGPALPSESSTRRGPIGPAMPPAQDPSAPVRDEWMLAPPVSSGYSERDPTKLKARKFASKPSSASAGGDSSSSGLAAIWTETPEEKLKRLQDAVLGRSDGSGRSAGEAAAEDARAREDGEKSRRIAEAIAARRGRSLYDEHQSEKERDDGRRKGGKKDEEEEDDPSKRAFDREKDMALGSKIGTAQRRELVAKSANFGGRFQKGSFL
ncbi:hypothetical protein LEL_01175 [Akanthomyces lecanii RCEF 1005]|uniref:DUF3752 domain-containing protein n=1 Tax=Akanthomyces lecanii RCEF 1005 TaxID=1081108 RepID=A0A168KFT0_CORDF|nr:hypothetical protein LEL_01175 [Akanthomyces lecanii RCEF 1005]